MHEAACRLDRSHILSLYTVLYFRYKTAAWVFNGRKNTRIRDGRKILNRPMRGFRQHNTRAIRTDSSINTTYLCTTNINTPEYLVQENISKLQQ